MNDAAHLALGGQMASTGYSDPSLTPIGGQGHQAWHMGCVFVLHGITLALFDRMTTGQGQYIDVSIHDACSIGTERAVPEWLYNGATIYRQTGMHAAARRQPDLELPTADGKYVIAVNQTFGDRGWAKLIKWMEEKGVAGELNDPKYRDEAVRMADYRQGTAVRDGIRRLIAASKGEEGFHRAQSYGISWGLASARPKRTTTSRTTSSATSGATSSTRRSAAPFPIRAARSCRMRSGSSPAARAPHLGEHTRQVLEHDLGLTAAQIDGAHRRRSDTMNAPARRSRKGILSGVRILDFTWKTVGPWAPRLLTHFGAEVIHVERVGSWDDHRYAGHPSPIIEGPQEGVHVRAGHRPSARRRAAPTARSPTTRRPTSRPCTTASSRSA